MYVVTKIRSAWCAIEWSSLDESGEPVTNTIRMKVELVDLDRFDEFVRVALHGGAPGGGVSHPVDFVRSVSTDWKEIVGEDGKPFAFTPKNLNIMIQAPGFLLGWVMSYIKAWNGQAEVREKNSEASPAAGPAGAEAAPKQPQKSS
jgi:hypothetical protein